MWWFRLDSFFLFIIFGGIRTARYVGLWCARFCSQMLDALTILKPLGSAIVLYIRRLFCLRVANTPNNFNCTWEILGLLFSRISYFTWIAHRNYDTTQKSSNKFGFWFCNPFDKGIIIPRLVIQTAFSLRFWPKIKQLLSLRLDFTFKTGDFVKISYKTKQPLSNF